MFYNTYNIKWEPNLTVTNTLDLVHRLYYNLDKNISILSKLSEIQNIFIDDYQLITMNKFNDNFTIDNNKIIPVPKDFDIYGGEYFTYYEIQNSLPKDSYVGIVNNIPLQNFLININKCDAHPLIFPTDKTYDHVCLHIPPDNSISCGSSLFTFPQTLSLLYKSLKSLNKNGNFYINLNYFYYEPIISLLQYVLTFFSSLEYIHNPLTSNSIGHNLLKFHTYNGNLPHELKFLIKTLKTTLNTKSTQIINTFYCISEPLTSSVIKTLFSNPLDDKFILFIKNIYKQQNEYLKFLIKRVQYIDYKKTLRHINNQIDIAITWCEKHHISVNATYSGNKVIVKPYILKRYFRMQRGIDLSRIKMTSDSLYSVSSPEVADAMSKIIKSTLPYAKVIIDATANVGGNTLSFASYFPHVISIEINGKTFEVLKNNVDVYNKKNVELIHDDFLNLADTITGDVIFMDPPWTGTFYKMNENMDLYLSNVNIIEIIPKLRCKIVALKLPLNYNIKGLLDKVNILEVHKLYNIMFVIIKK